MYPGSRRERPRLDLNEVGWGAVVSQSESLAFAPLVRKSQEKWKELKKTWKEMKRPYIKDPPIKSDKNKRPRCAVHMFYTSFPFPIIHNIDHPLLLKSFFSMIWPWKAVTSCQHSIHEYSSSQKCQNGLAWSARFGWPSLQVLRNCMLTALAHGCPLISQWIWSIKLTNITGPCIDSRQILSRF